MTAIPAPPRILPPHYFLLALIGIGLTAWLLPTQPLPAALRWSGLPLILAGLWLAITGSRLFARVGTNIIPLTRSSTLVTQGVFRISRNPMYVGMIGVLGGTTLLTQTVWGGLIVAGFSVLIRQQFVLKEEALLTATFGEEYLTYQRQVRRWI